MATDSTYPDNLVLRVNEVYHDVEGSDYEKIHPEIFIDEKARWERFGKQLQSRKKPLTILDIGTGTGFVPLTIAGMLKAEDRVICTDISETMLDVCQRNLKNKNFACSFEFMKLDGRTLPPDTTADYVLMNSVLHHIPDIGGFLSEVDRVLQPGGHLVIAHEPNVEFYANGFLYRNLYASLALIAPKSFIGNILRAVGLMEPTRKLYSKVSQNSHENRTIFERVNQQLLREGTIDKPLTSSQMTAIVDVHSPTAGGYHKDRGIDIKRIGEQYIPEFTLVSLDTYNYLARWSDKNRLARAYENFLGKRFPGKGSTLFAVMKKTPHTQNGTGES